MKTRLLSFLLLLLTYSTVKGQDFKVNVDTTFVNIKGALGVSLKHKNIYYCFFETENPKSTMPNETFYAFTADGTIISKTEVIEELNSRYKDLHVRNDSILVKTYYADNPTFYWDKEKVEWKRIKTVDDLIYEDNNYYVTSLDFGEWGGGTWFKDKKTGLEYEVAATTPEIFKLNNVYYLITGKIRAIEDPRKLKQIDEKYYYVNIREKGVGLFYTEEAGHSLQGTKILYEKKQDVDSFEDMFSRTGLYLNKSFVYNKQLLHIVTENNKTYIAKLANGKFEHIKDIGENINIYRYYNSYRNPHLNEIVSFFSEKDGIKKYGFLEVKGNAISLHYLRRLIK